MSTLAVFLLFGAALIPVDNPSSPPSPEIKAYTDCLLSAAQKEDDRVSDASTIALSIEGECVAQLQAVKEQLTIGMSPVARQMTFDKINQSQLGVAIGAVLAVRRSRAPAPSN